jgi:hypothetical protein
VCSDRSYPDFVVELLLPLVEPVKALLVALEELEWLRRGFPGADLLETVLAVDIPSRSSWLNCLRTR